MSNTSPATTGTINVNYVVMSILNRLRSYSMRDYSFLEQIIIECYTSLNLFHINNTEVVYLRMSDAKTVDLPADYVDYRKIGIPINGKLRVLTHNESILLPRTFEDGEYVGNIGDNVDTRYSIYFADHFRNGQFVAGLYGVPGGSDYGYYRIDEEKRQIIFSGEIPRGEVVLEYVSSGVKLQGSTVIPRETLKTLQNYAFWQLIEHDSKVPMNEKERKKQQYEEALEELRFFQTSFTKDEYLRHVYKHTYQSIKR